MNWDDPNIRPTSRPVVLAALQAFVEARRIACNIVGGAMPGSYPRYAHMREEWTVTVDWPDNDSATTTIRLHPPDDVYYYGVDADDLNRIRDALGADRAYVTPEGVISCAYDDPPEPEE